MKKSILSLGVMIAFAAPLVSSALTADELKAQIQSLLSQIQTLQSQLREQPGVTTSPVAATPSARAICRVVAARLAQGSEGGDVTSLQQFLSDEGYLSASPTGFFGPLTARALIQFQLQHGIIANANDGGEMGGRTLRFIMNRWCAARSAGETDPSQENGAIDDRCRVWFDGCNTCSRSTPGGIAMCTLMACQDTSTAAAYCKQRFPDDSGGNSETETPVAGGVTVSSFTGPTQLDVEQSGTWTVVAESASGAQLSYHITWGDESLGNALEALGEIANPSYVTETTFSHAYARVGVYTVAVTARDADGKTSRSRTSVRVVRPDAGTYPWLTPVTTGATSGGASNGEANSVVCPSDAKMCPDGTILSRTGPSCTFAICPLSQAAAQLIGVAMPGAGAPRAGEKNCTYGGKTYAELQTYSTPVPCVEGTSGSICGTKVYYCHFGAWFLKSSN